MQQQPKISPKYLLLLATAYVSAVFLTMIVENRVILVGQFTVLTGSLVVPFCYSISDMITEVYGYREMRKQIPHTNLY